MTPRQVDELEYDEYAAMVRWIEREHRERERQARAAERQARRR